MLSYLTPRYILRKWCAAAGKALAQLNSDPSGGYVVVVSQPFDTPQGWCILRGNGQRYWHQYYSTQAEAEAAKNSAGSAVFLGGEAAAIRLVTLDEDQVKMISNDEMYQSILLKKRIEH